MATTFEILPEAVEELTETSRALEEEHPGRGEKFEARVAVCFERIVDHPSQFRLVDVRDAELAGVRWVVVPDYTRFAIAYVDDPGRVVVLAVVDGHRAPGYWRRRLV